MELPLGLSRGRKPGEPEFMSARCSAEGRQAHRGDRPQTLRSRSLGCRPSDVEAYRTAKAYAMSMVHGLEEDAEGCQRRSCSTGQPKTWARVAEMACDIRWHWQTLGENRDHPRPGGAPAPTMLTLRSQKVP